MRRILWAVGVLWAVGLLACKPPPAYYAVDVVRERAARDFRCTETVSVDDLGAGAYRAHVCGKDALYICSKESADESDRPGSLYCVLDQGARPPPPPSRRPSRR